MLYPFLLSFLSVQIRQKRLTDLKGGAWAMEIGEEKVQDQFRSTFYYIGYNISREWKILWSRMTHPQVTQFWEPLRSLSHASVINGKHIYKLFPFPISQCTAFHTKLFVWLSKSSLQHILMIHNINDQRARLKHTTFSLYRRSIWYTVPAHTNLIYSDQK